jgi:hypothetical protein
MTGRESSPTHPVRKGAATRSVMDMLRFVRFGRKVEPPPHSFALCVRGQCASADEY